MQSFLKKASKKLVEDPDAAPEAEGEAHAALPNQKSKPTGPQKSTGGGGMHSAPAQAKKGTRKKI